MRFTAAAPEERIKFDTAVLETLSKKDLKRLQVSYTQMQQFGSQNNLQPKFYQKNKDYGTYGYGSMDSVICSAYCT